MNLAHVSYVFITLLAMVNPVEAAAAFATLTEGRSAQAQAEIARRATIVGFGILVAFGVLGEVLLRALGVSMEAFRIAGGLLLLKVAFDMVFAENTDRETADEVKTAKPRISDPSVFPLAIPIISGPGALTASVTVVSQDPGQLMAYAVLVGSALVVFAITYAAMRSAESLTRLLGRTGVDATGRVVGVLVAAIAIQFVISGLTGLGLIHAAR